MSSRHPVVITGLGVGFPYAAVFNGAAASVPASAASAQAVVGWGGLLTAIFGAPLVGVLLDATGSFTAGFLVLAAIGGDAKVLRQAAIDALLGLAHDLGTRIVEPGRAEHVDELLRQIIVVVKS